ncbi:hypothetical protein XELAEV_18005279mg [Xenopus laevis]|uniref:Uncharacterized protein n=1 Tax=Xenopus laevis TaxID=8355 RepID=A0A974I2H3_XENLA|nr:hypothetical protein XELAEV_18005279mg [Xenopus laevis]
MPSGVTWSGDVTVPSGVTMPSGVTWSGDVTMPSGVTMLSVVKGLVMSQCLVISHHCVCLTTNNTLVISSWSESRSEMACSIVSKNLKFLLLILLITSTESFPVKRLQGSINHKGTVQESHTNVHKGSINHKGTVQESHTNVHKGSIHHKGPTRASHTTTPGWTPTPETQTNREEDIIQYKTFIRATIGLGGVFIMALIAVFIKICDIDDKNLQNLQTSENELQSVQVIKENEVQKKECKLKKKECKHKKKSSAKKEKHRKKKKAKGSSKKSEHQDKLNGVKKTLKKAKEKKNNKKEAKIKHGKREQKETELSE